MTAPKLFFGAGGIGNTEGSFTYTWSTPEQVTELLKELKALGLLELDSAASYPPGNPWHTETLLGQAKAAEAGFAIDSKIAVHTATTPGTRNGTLTKERIEESVQESLRLLGVDKVNILYAHAPDGVTPIAESAAALHKQYVAGRFKELGLSNFGPVATQEWIDIAAKNGYVKPTVYQGNYNALYRHSETDLIPLLKKHGIKFVAYSPLAGGFLTGKVTMSKDQSSLACTRWVDASPVGQIYRGLWDQPVVHDEIRKLNQLCQDHGITLTEASLRWIMHHSALKSEDGLILGATKIEQVQSNVKQCRAGPLPAPIVDAMETMWKNVAGAINRFDI